MITPHDMRLTAAMHEFCLFPHFSRFPLFTFWLHNRKNSLAFGTRHRKKKTRVVGALSTRTNWNLKQLTYSLIICHLLDCTFHAALFTSHSIVFHLFLKTERWVKKNDKKEFFVELVVMLMLWWLNLIPNRMRWSDWLRVVISIEQRAAFQTKVNLVHSS